MTQLNTERNKRKPSCLSTRRRNKKYNKMSVVVTTPVLGATPVYVEPVYYQGVRDTYRSGVPWHGQQHSSGQHFSGQHSSGQQHHPKGGEYSGGTHRGGCHGSEKSGSSANYGKTVALVSFGLLFLLFLILIIVLVVRFATKACRRRPCDRNGSSSSCSSNNKQ
jgi:uncharacterized membrane protein